MSRTKRNTVNSEATKTVHPYKRKQRSSRFNDFELDYIHTNMNPSIQL